MKHLHFQLAGIYSISDTKMDILFSHPWANLNERAQLRIVKTDEGWVLDPEFKFDDSEMYYDQITETPERFAELALNCSKIGMHDDLHLFFAKMSDEMIRQILNKIHA